MLDYIGDLPNPHEAEFNDAFIKGTNDMSIEEFAIMAMREFEAVENIDIEKVEYIQDQDEIDINQHMVNINFKKKDLDSIQIPKFKYTTSSRVEELIFTIRIHTNLNEKTITKRILLPVAYEGFYHITGKKMKAIWQLVDASTYSQRGKITQKSRMPIIIYHNKHRMVDDVNGDTYVLSSYSYALETKSKKPGSKKRTKFFNPLMLYAAKMGMKNTRDFFGMEDIVFFSDSYEEKELEDYMIFPVDNMFVKVLTHYFDEYELVREFVCMCCNLKCKDFPLEYGHLEDREYWICRIGYVGSVKNSNIHSFFEKGSTTIYMVERLLDQTTIGNLRLPIYYKQNIYYLMYWMITNFDALKARSNMDMKNKRIRRNEYIVNSSLGKKINENLNKLIERKSKSRQNTMDTLLELFNFNSDIIVAGMRNLNDLVKTDELINDLTFLMDIAYSAKGPNSLGENGGKKIAVKYRTLDPSMAGILDQSTSSNSDVGMSGSFVPFVKLYNNYYFTPEVEPADARYKFDCALYKAGFDKWFDAREVDLASFERYTAWQYEHCPYMKMLQYEKIEIVEKEIIPVTTTQ